MPANSLGGLVCSLLNLLQAATTINQFKPLLPLSFCSVPFFYFYPSSFFSDSEMSDTLADLATWLPSEFLSDDDILLMDKENLVSNRNSLPRNNTHFLSFPNEFPYEFASPSSTESESDDEDVMAGLTRRFSRSTSLHEPHKITYSNLPNTEKKRVFSGSPESTLSWSLSSSGSHSQVPSPPTTPFVPGNDDAWELIYAAAGHVARMKMNMMKINHNNEVLSSKNRGLLGAPRSLAHPPHCSLSGRSDRNELLLSLNQQFCHNRGAAAGVHVCGDGGRPLGLPQSAWPPLQVQNHCHHQHRPNQRPPPCNGSVMKPVFLGGSGSCGAAPVKRECAGTGVFLPRRYSSNNPEPRKKAACSPAHLPARVVQSLSKNIDPMIAQPQARPIVNASFVSPYEVLLARRNAVMMAAQRRNIIRGAGMDASMSHPEVLLPQEWTY